MEKGKKDFSSTKKRSFDDSWRYLYALIIALFLMTFGFLASYSISGFELTKFSKSQEDLYYDFYKTKLQSDLFEFTDCSSSLEKMGTTLDFEGAMLSSLEQKLGKNSEELAQSKKYYYLLELSHLEFVKSINEKCDFNANFILFFYSNDKKQLDDAEMMGRILTYIKRDNPSVFIYSFDLDSKDSLVQLLKQKYEIKDSTTIIINEDTKLTSVKNSDEIKTYLK